jgi:hypothetical protein
MGEGYGSSGSEIVAATGSQGPPSSPRRPRWPSDPRRARTRPHDHAGGKDTADLSAPHPGTCPRGAGRRRSGHSLPSPSGALREACQRRRLSPFIAAGAALAAQRSAQEKTAEASSSRTWPRRTCRPLGGAAPRATAKDARGQVGVMLLRHERASMRTRPGMKDDDARARAVMPTWPSFTARDRSGHLAAGRHRQARVPARQSARRTIISRRLSDIATRGSGVHRRVYPARGMPPTSKCL